jgi:hypothetical protein
VTARALERSTWLAFYVVLGCAACTSDEERCRQANADATQAWQAHANAMQSGIDDARATQSEAQTKLTREVEPRLSDNAAKAANARYERSTDSWMRAYKAEQASACERDAQCKELRRQNHDAVERVKDLSPKLAAVKGVLAALGGDAEKTKTLADAITPESGNTLLTAAKTAGALAYETCKDVELNATPTR